MPSRLSPALEALRTGFDREQKDVGNAEALRSIRDVELLEGKLLKDQEITSGTLLIRHNLEREYRGFIPVKPLGGHTVHEDSASSADKTQYLPLRLSDDADIVHIYGKATIDGSGDPTLVTSDGFSAGVKSIAKSATGTYTIILGEELFDVATYDQFRFGEISVLSSTADDIRGQVATETVATDGTVKIYTLTGATKTSPASTSVLLFHFVLEKAVTLKTDLWVF